MPIEITDKLVKSLPAPASGNKITYDSIVKGFGIRVTKGGAKSFVLNYTVAGRERRFTIGEYPAWSVVAARKEARDLRQRVDRGEDPLQERIDDRDAPTLQILWEHYRDQHLPTKAKRAQDDDRSMWSKYILPELGATTKVADITAKDVDDLHRKIATTKPIRANRVIEVLRKALNLAIRWQWRTDNPCNGVQWCQETERDRFLSRTELTVLAKALDEHPNQTECDAIRLLLLTGARKSEVLKATWSMFDLEEGVWTKPSHHTKQRRPHRVPLSAPALALLKALRAEASKKDKAQPEPAMDFVFPNQEGAKPLHDVKDTWHEVRDAAKLVNVRLHDLRHTYASILVSAGSSLPIVGALLGHTQAQTTKRYAHLYDDPLRRATEKVGTALKPKRKLLTAQS